MEIMTENICYGSPKLTDVVVRVDFAGSIEKLEAALSEKFLKAIAEMFPIVEPEEVIMQEVALDQSGVKHSQRSTRHWNFFSKDREKQLVISPQCVFIKYSRYKSYEDMKGQFGQVVSLLRQNYPGVLGSRFGLRYINQIDLGVEDPTNWGKYINPVLLGDRGFFSEEEHLARLISISEIQYGDMLLRFQYGMPNPDYPAAIRRPLFVLDLDASVNEMHDLANSLDFLDSAHARIQNVFERSITDDLRETMNVRSISK